MNEIPSLVNVNYKNNARTVRFDALGMVQKVNDGASEWKLIIAKIPLLPCVCPPAAVPSAWTSVLTTAPCPPSVPAPCCPTGLPGSELCPLCLILPPSFLPLMICVPVFPDLHVCFGKTSTPEDHFWKSTTISEMVHTVPLTRMTHLLNFIQCQPTF